MSEYFGTEQQKKMQARVESAAEWISQTPGACNPGRFMGTDDPGLLGWSTIFETLENDGIYSFQLVRSNELEDITRKLAEHRYRIDLWDVFVATSAQVKPAVLNILGNGLPDEFRIISASEITEHNNILKFQSFLATNGIAPFSASMLAGEYGPATSVAIADKAGELAAVAHGYFPHNKHSPHCQNAWCGLVAVSPEYRGKSLGKFVNARLIANCIDDLGAKMVHQYVASSNVVSRKMVQSSGLMLEPDLSCGLAVSGGERFTR